MSTLPLLLSGCWVLTDEDLARHDRALGAGTATPDTTPDTVDTDLPDPSTGDTARSAWNQLMPGDHMPRAIEDSIKAYYIVQGNRALLKDEIKKHQRESWQPTRRDPKLTPLQEAAIVYDVLAAQHPDVIDGVPDPRAIFDQYGEAGVDRYRRKIEGVLFKGKRTADEARRKAKQMRKAGIR